jgi:hypothetical protein
MCIKETDFKKLVSCDVKLKLHETDALIPDVKRLQRVYSITKKVLNVKHFHAVYDTRLHVITHAHKTVTTFPIPILTKLQAFHRVI